MNTAIRLSQHDRYQATVPTQVLGRSKIVNVALIVVLVLCAFSVIYIKDLNRRLFIRYQGLVLIHDKLYEDWGKLLLEQSTWSTHARVRRIAEQRLNMSIPTHKEMVVLKRNK